jgi:hypothetical protein
VTPSSLEQLKYVRARLDDTILALEGPTPDYVAAYSKLYLVMGSVTDLRAVFAELKGKVRVWRPTGSGK